MSIELPRRFGKYFPREEDKDKGDHRDSLEDLPGGDQVADQREEALPEGPGDAGVADHEAALRHVGYLAEDVEGRLEHGQHAEGGGNLWTAVE